MPQIDKSAELTPYWRGLVAGFLVLGVCLLLLQYGLNRSFWQDEASLGLNIKERDMAGLLLRLDYEQSAPWGFLLVVEGITNVLGVNEYTLRLFPLIMGFITIALFIWVCRMITPTALPLAIALIATSAMHIDYATEFKQYALDASFTLLHWGLAIKISRDPKPKTILLAGFTGAIVVWFSHPVIFVLAGTGLLLWFNALRKKQWFTLRWLTIMGIMQLVSFGLVYWFAYRDLFHGTDLALFMNDFWGFRFLQLNLYSPTRILFELFIHLAGVEQYVLLVLVFYGFIFGVIRLPLQIATFIFFPMLLTCIASLLQMYPLSDRMLLFLLAPLLMIVALGWHSLINNLVNKNPLVGKVVLGVLVVLILMRIPVPIYKDDMRGAFAWLETVRQPDEPVYAIYSTWRAGHYYEFETIPFPAPIPTDRRVWIVIDRQLSHPQVNLFVNHTVYPFIGWFGIYVMCIPTDTTPCPIR